MGPSRVGEKQKDKEEQRSLGRSPSKRLSYPQRTSPFLRVMVVVRDAPVTQLGSAALGDSKVPMAADHSWSVIPFQ